MSEVADTTHDEPTSVARWEPEAVSASSYELIPGQVTKYRHVGWLYSVCLSVASHHHYWHADVLRRATVERVAPHLTYCDDETRKLLALESQEVVGVVTAFLVTASESHAREDVQLCCEAERDPESPRDLVTYTVRLTAPFSSYEEHMQTWRTLSDACEARFSEMLRAARFPDTLLAARKRVAVVVESDP